MNTYVMLDHTDIIQITVFFNSYHAVIEYVCISWWPAQIYPSYEWEIWIQQKLFVLNIPEK